MATRALVCYHRHCPEKASNPGVDTHGIGTGYAEGGGSGCRCGRSVGYKMLGCLQWCLLFLLLKLWTHFRLPCDTSPTILHLEPQAYRQYAYAGRAQCLYTKRDDGAMLPRRHDQSQHAYRQSVRKLFHGRMPAGLRLCMHSISNSSTVVPRECSRRDHPTRRPDLPLGSHSNSLDRSRSMHRKLHGMIIPTNIDERTPN